MYSAGPLSSSYTISHLNHIKVVSMILMALVTLLHYCLLISTNILLAIPSVVMDQVMHRFPLDCYQHYQSSRHDCSPPPQVTLQMFSLKTDTPSHIFMYQKIYILREYIFTNCCLQHSTTDELSYNNKIVACWLILFYLTKQKQLSTYCTVSIALKKRPVSSIYHSWPIVCRE